MPCFRLLRATRTHGGIRVIGAMKHTAAGDDEIAIPCQQCIGCRIDRAKQWALRCMHEASQHHNNQFVTLTYQHEPYGGNLVPQHAQKFMKRLRRARPGDNIRYYLCGEYGEKLNRPHYHACLFNVDFPDKKLWQIANGNRLYVSEELNEIWGADKEHDGGYTMLGELTWESAAYVARYVMKKITGKNAIRHYEKLVEETGEIIMLTPEFNRMSLKPAIGKNWFDQFSSDCFPSDFITHKGKKFKIPRYYDQQFEKKDKQQYEITKETRKTKAKQHEENNTPERLRTREKVLKARTTLLKRPLEQSEQ